MFSISVVIVLVITISWIEFNFIDELPVSYWKFDGTLEDFGTFNVDLQNSYPVFICGINATNYCFNTDNTFAKLDFPDTAFIKGLHFNSNSFVTSGYKNEYKYDFLDYDKPFTIETWLTPHQLCIGTICYHHYFLAKTVTDDSNKVTGFACGEQRDSSLYCYLRNPNEVLLVETKDTFQDGVPLKFSFTNDGQGTWNGTKIFINGIMVEKKYYNYQHENIPTVRNFAITKSIENDEPLVIGNYWIKRINPAVDLTIDELKIYNYEKTSEQILNDYSKDMNQIAFLGK